MTIGISTSMQYAYLIQIPQFHLYVCVYVCLFSSCIFVTCVGLWLHHHSQDTGQFQHHKCPYSCSFITTPPPSHHFIIITSSFLYFCHPKNVT